MSEHTMPQDKEKASNQTAGQKTTSLIFSLLAITTKDHLVVCTLICPQVFMLDSFMTQPSLSIWAWDRNYENACLCLVSCKEVNVKFIILPKDIFEWDSAGCKLQSERPLGCLGGSSPSYCEVIVLSTAPLFQPSFNLGGKIFIQLQQCNQV